MADDAHAEPTFAIPQRPTRRYHRRGGLEFEGETVFSLTPEDALEDDELTTVLESVLEVEPYRYGDWLDLPMPLYVVHDDETGDTFRVAVRDSSLEFHVLPETEPEGLRALYDRLVGALEASVRVERRVD